MTGGQKARVALARAVYAAPDICLLDDPLSAVDNHVGAVLVSECILGTLAEACVVLATHRYSSTLLNAASQIVMLEDGGRVAAIGTYHELIESGHMEPTEDHHDEGRTPTAAEAKALLKKKEALALEGKQNEQTGVEGARSSAEAGSALTGKEERSTGKVSAAVYKTYLDAFGGWPALAALLSGYVILQMGDVATNRWLAYWSTQASAVQDAAAAVITNMTTGPEDYDKALLALPFAESELGRLPYSHCHTCACIAEHDMCSQLQDGLPELGRVCGLSCPPGGDMDSFYYLGIYALLSFLYVAWNPVVLIAFMLGGLRAALTQHRRLLETVLRAPMSWFDTTPVGRVMNRFSGDMNIIDEVLPAIMQSFVPSALGCVSDTQSDLTRHVNIRCQCPSKTLRLIQWCR